MRKRGSLLYSAVSPYFHRDRTGTSTLGKPPGLESPTGVGPNLEPLDFAHELSARRLLTPLSAGHSDLLGWHIGLKFFEILVRLIQPVGLNPETDQAFAFPHPAFGIQPDPDG